MKSIAAKLAVGVLLLALISTILVSCGGGTQHVTITGVDRTEGENSLTQTQLDKVATVLGNNQNAYVAFVAAYRGYDMTAEGFDTSKDRPLQPVSTDAAKNVLKKYDNDKVLTEFIEDINEKDVESIVNKLKTDVVLNPNRGLFENIQYYIGVALNWMTNTLGFGNYIVGICIFAIIIEILLLPLGIKQQKNSIKQARLRPKEMAIRKKYAGRNDQATQQKIQQEISELYQRENFNPMGGCLPLLIQFPIIIVLYNIVINPLVFVLGKSTGVAGALQLYLATPKAAGGLGHVLNAQNGTIEVLSVIKEQGSGALDGIKDFLFISNPEAVHAEVTTLSSNVPSFNIGPINFGLTPSFNGNYWLLLVPVLTFVVYFFSMKLTKKFTYQPASAEQSANMGCSTKMMDITMPLMSVFFTFIVPGVVGVYWIFKSIIGTLKQFILSKIMPLPKFTEEDFKAAERELNSKSPQKKKTGGASSERKVRSLHYIDEEDDETAPAPAPTPKKKKSDDSDGEKTESPIEQAPLKEDDRKECDKKND